MIEESKMKTRAGDTMFGQIGSIIASLMFIWAIFEKFFPFQIRNQAQKHTLRLFSFVYPYIQITFNELIGDRHMSRSEAYTSIQNYLSSKATTQAKRLKGDIGKNNQTLLLTMDDHEEVCDEFNGVKLWWVSGKNVAKSQTLSLHNNLADEKRYYKLTFHKQHRNMVLGTYLNHVMREGKAVMVRNRQRKLYTNSGSFWNHVVFEHPATFESVAMDEELKKRIIDDLVTFSKSREFYARIGRAWKRGYLLFGPPGTGKSTMIAAMANLLGYDLYDLELTAVKDNTELRKLLIETSSKSIIVIEDIDCSLDLTGQRRKKMERAKEDEEEEEEEDQRKKKQSGLKERDVKSSQVTLSGLLNFIDGLWSACGGERLIVFTTNYVEKLDPALVRRGRMDMHIELSYCGFEAFKLLAKNYLKIESHHLFSTISDLLKHSQITPADVAEHFMPKPAFGNNPDLYLKALIQSLEETNFKQNKHASNT
ncbi:hypothetical protein HN51_032744 [Arachis hypogaea]|uniref:AAA+ ATPase domain-containing protein n=2 Tax=Arachis TaxID=3817 RepID=A0A445B3C9_ARAHY|nr:AAA-ATPase ASD, mitochondrial [Arachis duranensis]XP_025624032.1 AAA-ATPase ASD, mitochondrial [Arachis hypogaea]QHO17102.1 AAA-ATPase ASD [Arachis hypogaea]RYR33184.1 hypothetical protein Ahy_A10g047753 [Arachis hypogaea]